MDRYRLKKPFMVATVASLLVHLLVIIGGSDLGSLSFTKPLRPTSQLSMEIASAVSPPQELTPAPHPGRHSGPSATPEVTGSDSDTGSEPDDMGELLPEDQEVPETPEGGGGPAPPEVSPPEPTLIGPVRSPQEFLSALTEKFAYRVSILGLAVGKASLEASRAEGDLRLTARLHAGQALSPFFRLADVAETRLLGGKYLIARLRQEEGDFRSDTGFTLCFPEKRVVWADRLRNIVISSEIPDDSVLDLLAAFYLLRQRTLTVGETFVLNVYDGGNVVDTAVDVVGRERIVLPGDREMATVVIRPHLQSEGMLRSGELRFWFSDNDEKVPVKMEAALPWGRVTAELVAAEVTFPPRIP